MRAIALLVTIGLLAGFALADIPTVISYQGKVTDASGNPVADGSYNMQFDLYDAETGGTLLWSSGSISTQVSGGVFSVLLGESPQPALTLDFAADYWLLVTFNGVDQTPRQRMASTGYAYMASGLVAGTEVSGAVTTGTLAAIKGTNTATTGATFGVAGFSASAEGVGLYGQSTATSGATHGVFGESTSTTGRGVSGVAWATAGETYGVGGSSLSASGMGVYGIAWATTGWTYGVYGVSYSGSGWGVYGEAAGTTGYAYGGSFVSSSTGGRGVYGSAVAPTGTTYGVHGQSASRQGRGVYGEATATRGTTYGVCGRSLSTGGMGVCGDAPAATGATYGVYGLVYSTSGFGVYYVGGLAGTGTKSCVVKTSKGPTLMYCQESPENWFEDFGEGQLVNGRCHVELDPVFLETVTIDAVNPMKVFVEFDDEKCAGAAVKRGATGFYLVERLGGTSSCSFWYRVVAKRKGFEEKRLDYCAAAERDSYLYPELREKELQEYEEERAQMEEYQHLLEPHEPRSMMAP